ncbi:hypothetical protein, partial [Glutamicibacter sp.]|uniref:hypothetical protein n=1 Tax=Glutamicibacter sp. TaxID=1931995 RepID=UPI002FDAC107
NPKYREMMLGDGLTPMSKLSGAFLSPKTPLHLQFAYYESSLAVEFLVEKYGFEALKKILHLLSEGVPINDAIAAHTASLEKVQRCFASAQHDNWRIIAGHAKRIRRFELFSVYGVGAAFASFLAPLPAFTSMSVADIV